MALHCRCIRNVNLLTLSILLCFFLKTFGVAAEYNVDSFDVISFTPDLSLMDRIFNAEVNDEIPDEDTKHALTRLEWKRLYNQTSPAPFVMCTSEGRDGVKDLVSIFNASLILPIDSQSSLSCYIVYAKVGVSWTYTGRRRNNDNSCLQRHLSYICRRTSS